MPDSEDLTLHVPHCFELCDDVMRCRTKRLCIVMWWFTGLLWVRNVTPAWVWTVLLSHGQTWIHTWSTTPCIALLTLACTVNAAIMLSKQSRSTDACVELRITKLSRFRYTLREQFFTLNEPTKNILKFLRRFVGHPMHRTSTTLRSALFWDITQRRVVILYRRFRTTYRSHLQWSYFLTLEDGTNTWSRNVRTELHTQRCVIPQKSADPSTSRRKPEVTVNHVLCLMSDVELTSRIDT
jgi:hypothetical protein